MTNITLHNRTEVKAQGKHINGNSKLTVCITTGEVFASMLDAAEKENINPSCISIAIKNVDKGATCKGKRYCRASDVIFYLDEISRNINEREEKAAAYDALMAEEKAAREAEALRQKEMTATETLISKLEAKAEKLRINQNHTAKMLCEAKNKLTMLKREALI